MLVSTAPRRFRRCRHVAKAVQRVTASLYALPLACGTYEDSERAVRINQTSNWVAGSNKLQGFTQQTLTTRGTRTIGNLTVPVVYSLDAAGNFTSDGLRQFSHDAANRISAVKLSQNQETASQSYWHNAIGQRTFNSDFLLGTPSVLRGRWRNRCRASSN